MSHQDLLPANILSGLSYESGQAVKRADEKTKQLLFELMLIVDFEANVHRLAHKFSEHDPKLYSQIFETVETFYAEPSRSSSSSQETETAVSPVKESQIPRKSNDKKKKGATRKRPAKKRSSEKKSPRKKSPVAEESRRRRKPPKKSSRKLILVTPKIESSSSEDEEPSQVAMVVEPDMNSLKYSYSSEEEEEMPTTFVKMGLATTVINDSKVYVQCSFEGCSTMILNCPSHIKQHERVHSEERPYKCNMCSKSFKRKFTLNLHIQRHRGERPYKCEICQKGFAQPYNLTEHTRTHTGEKPHACDKCPMRFASGTALKSHARAHTDETPYHCHGCEKQFKNPGSLKRHLSNHHLTETSV